MTYDASSGDYDCEYRSNSVTISTWTHIAIVRNSTTQTLRLYIDGVFDNSESYSHISLANITNRFVVGTDTDSSSHEYTYSGYMDELAIWNKALTDSDIETLYNTQSQCL